MSVNLVSKNMVSEDNVKRRKTVCNPKTAMVTETFLRNWRLIEEYLSPATRIKAASLLSNRFSAALKPAKDKVVQAALEKPQLVAYAKKHMSKEQYQAIKERCCNQVCRAFFAEVADQIQANKDHATLALAAALRGGGLPIPEGEIEEIREWLNNPANSADIQGVTELCFEFDYLKVLPDELSLLTGLIELDLSHNQLESIDVSRLTQVQYLYLSHNQLESIDVSRLTQLKELWLNDNVIESVKGLSELTQLTSVDLSYNDLESIDVSRLTQLKRLILCDNKLLKRVSGLSGLTQLHRLDLGNTPLQANKDHATLALAAALRRTGLRIPEGDVEEIRAWLNNPANSAAIQGVTVNDVFIFQFEYDIPYYLKYAHFLRRCVRICLNE